MDNIDLYLEKTGQDFTDLMAGASQYGPVFITEELVPKALKENKRIVWVTRLVDGEDLGLVDFKLEPI